jgi:hypothetical protein
MGFGSKKAPNESPVASSSAPSIIRQTPASDQSTIGTKSKKKHPLHLLSVTEATLPHISSPISTIRHRASNYRLSKAYSVPLVKREDECTTKPSTERLFWSQKNGRLLLHPFSSDGVPYLVAYDGVLIQK